MLDKVLQKMWQWANHIVLNEKKRYQSHVFAEVQSFWEGIQPAFKQNPKAFIVSKWKGNMSSVSKSVN